MLGLVLLLTLVSLVFSLLGPYLMGLAIDRYVVGRDLAGLGRIALLMLTFYAADWLSQIGQERITATVAQQVLYTLPCGASCSNTCRRCRCASLIATLTAS